MILTGELEPGALCEHLDGVDVNWFIAITLRCFEGRLILYVSLSDDQKILSSRHVPLCDNGEFQECEHVPPIRNAPSYSTDLCICHHMFKIKPYGNSSNFTSVCVNGTPCDPADCPSRHPYLLLLLHPLVSPQILTPSTHASSGVTNTLIIVPA